MAHRSVPPVSAVSHVHIDGPGGVYLISGAPSDVKAGMSYRDPIERLRENQTGNPAPLTFIATMLVPYPDLTEKAMLWYLEPWKAAGGKEWAHLPASVVALLVSSMNEHPMKIAP